MATTTGSHSVAAFTAPINGTSPIDANSVRNNDNTLRTSYVNHDSDTGIHVQSSDLASRPAAGIAGRKWMTIDGTALRVWYDTGTAWVEAANPANVVGPASAADNAIVRFDLTTGKLIQNSSITVSDLSASNVTLATSTSLALLLLGSLLPKEREVVGRLGIHHVGFHQSRLQKRVTWTWPFASLPVCAGETCYRQYTSSPPLWEYPQPFQRRRHTSNGVASRTSMAPVSPPSACGPHGRYRPGLDRVGQPPLPSPWPIPSPWGLGLCPCLWGRPSSRTPLSASASVKSG